MVVLNQEVIGKTFHFNTNNMNRILSFSLTLIFAMVLASCSSKQSPVNELKSLAKDLTENSTEYSSEDWENAITKYAEIEQELQQNTYSDEELKMIGKYKAQCLRAVAKSSASILKKQMHDYKMQMEGASEEMEGIVNDMSDIFRDTFNDDSE